MGADYSLFFGGALLLLPVTASALCPEVPGPRRPLINRYHLLVGSRTGTKKNAGTGQRFLRWRPGERGD